MSIIYNVEGSLKTMIKKGSLVKIHYTIECEGKVVENTQDRGVFSYVQGEDKLLVSVQKRLEGLNANEEVSFELEPPEAYGDYRPEAEEDIPRSEVPQWGQVKVGMYLQEKQADGRIKVGRVIEVGDDSIRLSFNHPMAGKKIKYRVKVIDVINMETKE